MLCKTRQFALISRNSKNIWSHETARRRDAYTHMLDRKRRFCVHFSDYNGTSSKRRKHYYERSQWKAIAFVHWLCSRFVNTETLRWDTCHRNISPFRRGKVMFSIDVANIFNGSPKLCFELVVVTDHSWNPPFFVIPAFSIASSRTNFIISIAQK